MRERTGERENRREIEQERENMVTPVHVDNLTSLAILGHICTSGNVVRRGVDLRSTRYTEGPDRCSMTLSIVRLVRTECIRRRHGKCSTEGSLQQTYNPSREI